MIASNSFNYILISDVFIFTKHKYIALYQDHGFYGELGRYPLEIRIKMRMLSFGVY
jgi:citrate lyase synthetase